MRYVHLFASYLDPRDSERKRWVFLTRDLSAAWEVVGALQLSDFWLGRQLFNYPPPVGQEPTLLVIDCSDISPHDIILTATRPPLSDSDQLEKRRVPKGFTTLEVQTDSVWKLYFKILSRSHAELAGWLHPHLPESHPFHRDMFFLQSAYSHYKLLHRRPVKVRGRTAVFLVVQPELWPGGPTFVGFFGMDGVSTLAWAHLLRHRHSDLLHQPGFHMLELHSAPVPERVPDMRWADEWRAELLFSVDPRALPADLQTAAQEKSQPMPVGPSRKPDTRSRTRNRQKEQER
jgi:hypothetical protein